MCLGLYHRDDTPAVCCCRAVAGDILLSCRRVNGSCSPVCVCVLAAFWNNFCAQSYDFSTFFIIFGTGKSLNCTNNHEKIIISAPGGIGDCVGG